MSGDATQVQAVHPLTQWKSFLESTPANTGVKIARLGMKHVDAYKRETLRIAATRIQLHCQRDGGVRGFDCKSGEIVLGDPWEWEFIYYVCRDCGQTWKRYAVLISRKASEEVDAEVMKLGEYPPFSAPISKRVEKLLEKADLEMYRRGTRSEAQGLGVGAATYFRRIVDSQWKLLVTEIRDAAAELGVRIWPSTTTRSRRSSFRTPSRC
jgi:hypothetical protein